jgi:hypothetical protein
MYPLIERLEDSHFLYVQTYLKKNTGVLGAKYAFKVVFAQTVVWNDESSELKIRFIKLGIVEKRRNEK